MKNKNPISDEELFKLKDKVYDENNGILSYCYEDLLKLVVPGNKLQEFAHSLFFKFVTHSLSLMYLAKGTKAFNKDKGKEYTIYDVDSVFTIYRTIIDNYLTFFSILYYPKSNEEIDFRYNIYSFVEAKHSFQNFSLMASDEEVLKVNQENPFFHIDLESELQNRKLELDKLSKEVFDNPQYGLLNSKQRSSLKSRNPSWKIDGSWNEIADLAGFNKTLFNSSYSMLSSSAHSGKLSVGNIDKEGMALEREAVLLSTTLNNIPSILGKFILEFLEFFTLKKIVKEDVHLYGMIIRKISIAMQTGIYKKDSGLKEYVLNYLE